MCKIILQVLQTILCTGTSLSPITSRIIDTQGNTIDIVTASDFERLPLVDTPQDTIALISRLEIFMILVNRVEGIEIIFITLVDTKLKLLNYFKVKPRLKVYLEANLAWVHQRLLIVKVDYTESYLETSFVQIDWILIREVIDLSLNCDLWITFTNKLYELQQGVETDSKNDDSCAKEAGWWSYSGLSSEVEINRFCKEVPVIFCAFPTPLLRILKSLSKHLFQIQI